MKIAFLSFILAVIVALAVVVGIIGVVFTGYGAGLLITLIPFLPALLVGGPVTVASIPVITAWLAVASAMFALFNVKLNIGVSKPEAKTEVFSKTITK